MSLIFKSDNGTEVTFDSYCLYNGETDEYSEDGKELEGYEVADVYICPHCIKKYGLYSECDTKESTVDASIGFDEPCYENTPICGVKGCNNRKGFDGVLFTTLCRVIND